MKYDFAQNTQKLRRILDTMPNASVEEVKAEYIKQGGLVLIEENNIQNEVKPTVTETVKKVTKKAVKKVTKK